MLTSVNPIGDQCEDAELVDLAAERIDDTDLPQRQQRGEHQGVRLAPPVIGQVAVEQDRPGDIEDDRRTPVGQQAAYGMTGRLRLACAFSRCDDAVHRVTSPVTLIANGEPRPEGRRRSHKAPAVEDNASARDGCHTPTGMVPYATDSSFSSTTGWCPCAKPTTCSGAKEPSN
ncbi:hypothetical protein [Streptomyces sp. NPDC002845]